MLFPFLLHLGERGLLDIGQDLFDLDVFFVEDLLHRVHVRSGIADSVLSQLPDFLVGRSENLVNQFAWSDIGTRTSLAANDLKSLLTLGETLIPSVRRSLVRYSPSKLTENACNDLGRPTDSEASISKSE